MICEPPPRTHLRQVLRLIDQDGCRLPEGKRAFDGMLVLSSDGFFAWREPDDHLCDSDRCCRIDFIIDQRLFHSKQKPSKVVAPTEAARFGRDAFDADNRDAPGVI